MDENISQSPSMFEQFLRYGLLLTGLLGIGFDIWWFLDAQSNNYLNGVLIGLTVASLISNVGFCLPKERTFEKYTLFFLIFIRSVTFDQMTKLWVVNHIDYRYGEIPVIEGLFSFVHTQNPGAAFGIMEGQMTFFAVFTIIAIFVVGSTLKAMQKDDYFQNVALSLIASGAIGNAIDRIHKQSVTDFLRLYTESPTWKPWLQDNIGMAEWPSFNIADSAIVVGIIMFAFYGFFVPDEEDNEDIDLPEYIEDQQS